MSRLFSVSVEELAPLFVLKDPIIVENRKQAFLKKWHFLRLGSHFFSIATLAIGIWIVVGVAQFYKIAFALAEESSYHGDLQVRFLDDCATVGWLLIIAATISFIFGILSVLCDDWLNKNHKKKYFVTRYVFIAGVMAMELTAGVFLWNKALNKNPSSDLVSMIRLYADLPTELSGDGALFVLPYHRVADQTALRATLIISTIQILMECCGAESGYEDFADAPYYAETFPIFPPPPFCCKFADPNTRTLLEKVCYSSAARLSGDFSNFHKGCVAALTDYHYSRLPVMLGWIFAVVLLKSIVHLVHFSTKWFRSDSVRCVSHSKRIQIRYGGVAKRRYGSRSHLHEVWFSAYHQCGNAARLIKEIGTSFTTLSITNHRESYERSMSNLSIYRDTIEERIGNIVECLRTKRPADLSDSYNQLPNDLRRLVDECKHSISRISKVDPFRHVKQFDYDSSEALCCAIRKMRKGCDMIIDNRNMDSNEKLWVMKRIMKGVLSAYNHCRLASKEAATVMTFERFAHYAEQISASGGALLHEMQLHNSDTPFVSREAERLKSVGHKIGKFFAASNLLTANMKSYRQKDAESEIKERAEAVKESLIHFLTTAKLLTVMDNDTSGLKLHWRDLERHCIDVKICLLYLHRCIEYQVPGVMDCSDVLYDIESLLHLDWERLSDLADPERPLADFCIYLFDVSQMQKILDKIAVTAIRQNKETVYTLGRLIIQLDSHRRFLQLELCGLASKTVNADDREKLFDGLRKIVDLSSILLRNCCSYIENRPVGKDAMTLKSMTERLAIETHTKTMNSDLESLYKLHQRLRDNNGYKVTGMKADHAPDCVWPKMINKLPTEVFRTLSQICEESTEMPHDLTMPELQDDLTDINRTLRKFRLVVEGSTGLPTPDQYFTGTQLLDEINAFRRTVQQTIHAEKSTLQTNVGQAVFMNNDAVERLFNACQISASSCWVPRSRLRILKSGLNAAECYADLLTLIAEDGFQSANAGSQHYPLEALFVAIESSLKQIANESHNVTSGAPKLSALGKAFSSRV